MDNREADISKIKKYLEGKLDARAMHQLEKRALDDPFLMDALEGYGKKGAHQKENLDALTARLQQRVADKKVRRMIPWVPVSVAASILVIISAGLWFYTSSQQPETLKVKRIASDVKPASTPSMGVPPPLITKNDTLAGNLKAAQYEKNVDKRSIERDSRQPKITAYSNKLLSAAATDAASDAPVLSQDVEQTVKRYKDSAGINDVVVSSFDGNKKKDTLDKAKMAARSSSLALKEIRVQGKVEGVTANPANTYGVPQKTINGVVIAKDDGQPITGAVVKVLGSSHGAVTDKAGKFSLQNVTDNQTLAVGYIGYSTKQVKVNNGDSLNITLDPNHSALAEVVVTSSKRSNNKENAYEDARPKDGWKAFDAYLKNNGVSTDGKTGKVKVSFMVDGKGQLSNFKIIKSLSKIADQKAIDLIQYGPDWFGRTDKQPFEVKVNVKFH